MDVVASCGLCAIHARITQSETTSRPVYKERLTARQVRDAQEYLAAHAGVRVRTSEVAARCSLSRSHFSRAFKQTTGQTPQQWLLMHRIERVRALLRGDQEIATIAADCGFADQSHLTRVFTKTIGVPPGAFRRAAYHTSDQEFMS